MTDFTAWSRGNLERLAQDLEAENAALREELRVALAGWRWAAATAPAPLMSPDFVNSLLEDDRGQN